MEEGQIGGHLNTLELQKTVGSVGMHPQLLRGLSDVICEVPLNDNWNVIVGGGGL